METKEQPKLRFKGVDFPNINLKSLKPYNKETSDVNIKIDITPRVFIPANSNNRFKIVMTVDLSAEDYFNLSVIGVGSFEITDPEIDAKTRKSFINANSTAIMFPYVRSFISTLTSNIGTVLSPIILPTRFFKGDIEELVDESNPSEISEASEDTTEEAND